MSCLQLLEQGGAHRALHTPALGSQLMSWSQRKTVTHTQEVIHEKNSQESPSGLQILSFPKCQEPTAVLLILLGPLVLAEGGQCQVAFSFTLQGQAPRATLQLALSNMDRKAHPTLAQAQVQVFCLLRPFVTSSGPHPQRRHSCFPIWSLCSAGNISHSSWSVRISSVFPRSGHPRRTSVKPFQQVTDKK